MGRRAWEAFPEVRRAFSEADAVLGFSLSQLCFQGSEEQLRLTENTQPAILTLSVGLYWVLGARGLRPGWLAGHSLGEYSALVAAGSLELADAVRLVRQRGRYMQEAVPPGEGAMAAILGLDADTVALLCSDHSDAGRVEVANLNAPGQTVIAGHRVAVELVAERAKEAGARRALMLEVSAPFHCSLMEPAAERLAEELRSTGFRDPEIPVVCNVDARPLRQGKEVREALIRQVTAPVRWVETVKFLGDAGVEVVVEVGPGRVLSGLVRRTLRGIRNFSAEEPEEVETVLGELQDGTTTGGGG